MRVTIEKLVYGGAGLARTEDGVVFVPRSAPGDVLEIHITQRKKDYAVGRIVEILTPSPDRQPPDCPNYSTAGCCHWLHIRYERQLAYKEAILRETLRRGAKIDWRKSISLISGPDHHYRMRASFHVFRGKLGFVAEHSHTVVPIRECASLTEGLNGFVAAANEVIGSAEFEGLQQVHAVSGESISATFLFSETVAAEQRNWDRVRDAVFQMPQMATATISVGSERIRYEPRPAHVDVLGFKFGLNSEAFFQANRFLLDGFATEVVDQGSGFARVLELYSGAGFFSIPLARKCKELIGIESHSLAVFQAKDNARLNGAQNVQFVIGDAEESLAKAELKPDLILLNPPRIGAGPKVAKRVTELKPGRIVYVSCNPATFAREAAIFIRNGYEMKRLTMIDQFPNTYHIELAASFDAD